MEPCSHISPKQRAITDIKAKESNIYRFVKIHTNIYFPLTLSRPEECYSQDAAAACRNESLFFYNKSCITVDEYCGLRGFGVHNASHCFDPKNESFGVSEAEGIVPRISPTEDYFRLKELILVN